MLELYISIKAVYNIILRIFQGVSLRSLGIEIHKILE